MKKLFCTTFIFSYLFLYGVKVLGIPVGSYIAVFSILYIFKKKILDKFIYIWWKELGLISILIFYILFIEYIFNVQNYNEKFSIYLIRIILDGLLPSYVICDNFKTIILHKKYFEKILLNILLFQILISIIMFFNNDLKLLIIHIMTNYDPNNPGMLDHLYQNRGYGLGYSYLSWFPFSIAIIFIYLIYADFIKNNFEISIILLSVLLIIFINARIGVVPLLVGLPVYAIVYREKSFSIMTILLALAFAFYLALISISFDNVFIEKIEFFQKWVLEDGFASFFSDDGSKLLKDLSNLEILEKFNFIDYIFGKGIILNPEYEEYNDIGYLQILFNGGIILSFSLYLFFYLIIYNLYNGVKQIKFDRSLLYFLPAVFYLALLIGNLKLRIFEINEATRFLFLLVSYWICRNNYEIKNYSKFKIN